MKLYIFTGLQIAINCLLLPPIESPAMKLSSFPKEEIQCYSAAVFIGRKISKQRSFTVFGICNTHYKLRTCK